MAISYFSQTAPGNKGALKTVLVTACIVAVVDGLAAIVITWTLHDRSPLLVFQYIASGLLGTTAFSGGLSSVFIGVICHFFISLIWTTIFFFVHCKVSAIIPNQLLKTILYGVTIWLGMNLVVLPLSRVPMGPREISGILIGMITLILAAGWPIARCFDKYFFEK